MMIILKKRKDKTVSLLSFVAVDNHNLHKQSVTPPPPPPIDDHTFNPLVLSESAAFITLWGLGTTPVCRHHPSSWLHVGVAALSARLQMFLLLTAHLFVVISCSFQSPRTETNVSLVKESLAAQTFSHQGTLNPNMSPSVLNSMKYQCEDVQLTLFLLFFPSLVMDPSLAIEPKCHLHHGTDPVINVELE